MTDVPDELQDQFHQSIEKAYELMLADQAQEALDAALQAYAIYTDYAEMWDHHVGAKHALIVAAETSCRLGDYAGGIEYARRGVLLCLQHLFGEDEAGFITQLSQITRASGDLLGARIYAFAAEAMLSHVEKDDTDPEDEVEVFNQNKEYVQTLIWQDIDKFCPPDELPSY
jgi:hypothetical protein